MESLTDGIAYAKSVDAGKRSVEATFSSEAVDRQGDIIDQASWKLDAYRRNPVVLFAHDHTAPIGRTEDLQISGGKLEGTIVFASTPRGDEVLQLFKEKALRAFSVGFRVGRITEEQTAAGVTVSRLLDCELWEISAVAVPANPDAVAKCKSLGLVPANYTREETIAEAATRRSMMTDEAAQDEHVASMLRQAGLR